MYICMFELRGVGFAHVLQEWPVEVYFSLCCSLASYRIERSWSRVGSTDSQPYWSPRKVEWWRETQTHCAYLQQLVHHCMIVVWMSLDHHYRHFHHYTFSVLSRCSNAMVLAWHTYFTTVGHLYRVNDMKKTLLFQAEESARLSRESKELERKLAQLEESHKWVVCTLVHIIIITCMYVVSNVYYPNWLVYTFIVWH